MQVGDRLGRQCSSTTFRKSDNEIISNINKYKYLQIFHPNLLFIYSWNIYLATFIYFDIELYYLFNLFLWS